MEKQNKEQYETPEMEVVVFELEDSIAVSGVQPLGSNSFCGGE